MFLMDSLLTVLLMIGYAISECEKKEVICISGSSIIGAGPHYGTKNCSVVVKQLNDSLMRVVTNCTQILFMNRSTTLDVNFSLQNLSDITLASVLPGGTVISCSAVRNAGSIGSGFTFMAIQNLEIVGVTLKECGALHNYSTTTITIEGEPLQFRTAIYMNKCENVYIIDSKITRSNGRGVSLFDIKGNLTISETLFTENEVSADEKYLYSGGGGLFIEITYCGASWTGNMKCPASSFPNISHANYVIKNCTFIKNNFTNHLPNESIIAQGGGAIAILIKGNAAENQIRIDNVTATHNKAHSAYGGGLFMQFRDSSRNNALIVMDSNFSCNEAKDLGGGGINAGYDFFIKNDINHELPRNNVMTFSNLWIQGNHGNFGGGGTFFSGPSPAPLNNSFLFFKCTWYQNKATFGSALMISPKLFGAPTSVYIPLLAFSKCNFTGNMVVNSKFSNHLSLTGLDQETEGIGTVYIRSFTIELRDWNWFDSNEGSAIYALSSVVRVPAGGHADFSNNKNCVFGGAVHLIGPSSIQIGNNSYINFTNNTASSRGGAVYGFNTDKGSSKTFGLCFIQYIDTVPQMGKIKSYIQFEGNSLSSSKSSTGRSVFVSSLLPCTRFCANSKVTPSESLECIANISFIGIENITTAVATEGSYFITTRNISFPEMVVPGKLYSLPVKMMDEVGNTIESPLLRVTIIAGSVELKQAYTINKHVTFYGVSGASSTMKIQTINYHNVSFSIKIQLSECPPGFVNNVEMGSCVCSVYNAANQYNGIFACDQTKFQAHLQIGYWAGYVNNSGAIEEGSPKYLAVGTCPLGFCVGSKDRDNTYITLPATSDGTDLTHSICDKNRKGILCGECVNGYSVFFHSFTYRCGPNDLCQYGVIFYLLSEIVPLTVIFCVTIFFRVNFTSGYLNGFILFAQMLDSLSLAANGGVLITSRSQRVMLNAIHLIYSPFNLDLFEVDGLDFCLYKGANFLHIISFRFLSLAYSLILVLVLIFLMRCNFCYKLQLVCFRMHITNSSSLLNGLSTFLILCYSQCCRICYRILNMSWLQGQGFKYINPPRVFRMGSLAYTNPSYVGFACLAGAFLVVFVIIPPLLLILQPLSHKVLPARCFERGKLRALCIHFDLLQPLFDTLQGCFKDRFRYFAGFYLIYRLLPNVIFALINMRLIVFTLTQVCLITMLALHCWAKPYKQNIHNNIDTAIFLNLLVINSITIYRYFLTQSTTSKFALTVGTYIQLTFVYLPALFLLIFVLCFLIRRLWQKKVRTEETLPDLILSRSVMMSRSMSDGFSLKKSYYDSTTGSPLL